MDSTYSRNELLKINLVDPGQIPCVLLVSGPLKYPPEILHVPCVLCWGQLPRRVYGSLQEPEFAAPRRAAPRGLFSGRIRCLGTPFPAVDQ